MDAGIFFGALFFFPSHCGCDCPAIVLPKWRLVEEFLFSFLNFFFLFFLTELFSHELYSDCAYGIMDVGNFFFPILQE
jgi:hypothetical protein